MSLDKMRAEFEARFPLPPGVWWGGNSYLGAVGVVYSITNAIKWDVRWETWQASRATLVVQLPVGESLNIRMYGEGRNTNPLIFRSEAVAALEAAGVRVAP